MSGILTPKVLFQIGNEGGAIQLKYLDPIEGGAVNWKKVQELASIELMFDLHYSKNVPISEVENQFITRGVSLPCFVSIPDLEQMNNRNMANTVNNITAAQESLVEFLDSCFVPHNDDLLYKWIADSGHYTRGSHDKAECHADTMTLGSFYILRHIMYTHNLPLNTVISLWALFYTLIMGQALAMNQFISPTALWNNTQRMHHIDQALWTADFTSRITKPTSNGFTRKFYTASDDSKHINGNRHVVIMSCAADEGEPSFRHMTSSVNEVKTRNAEKNTDLIIEMHLMPKRSHALRSVISKSKRPRHCP